MIDANINHPPVAVPQGTCPFDEKQLKMFREAMFILRQSGDVPEGYGVLEHEWGPEGYNLKEEIKVGMRRDPSAIELPQEIWLPRAKDWARALHITNSILRAL